MAQRDEVNPVTVESTAREFGIAENVNLLFDTRLDRWHSIWRGHSCFYEHSHGYDLFLLNFSLFIPFHLTKLAKKPAKYLQKSKQSYQTFRLRRLEFFKDYMR